jgi:hypothetical protein
MGGYKIYNNVLKIRFKNEEISSNISSNGFVFRPNLSEKFVSNKLNILDIQSNFVYHNKNWLYSFSENLFSYSYDLTSYVFWNYFYQDSSRLNYKVMWYNSILNNNHNLFISIILDQLFFIAALSLPFFNDFFHHLINSDEFNNFLIIHPEYYFIYKKYTNNFYQNYLSNIYLSMYLLTINESFISPIMMITQFFFIFFLVLLFIITYFSYFNNFNNEDNIIDHDYLSFNVTVEAEEEIGSMDDMLLTSVILLYIFLWFFWINSWSYLSITPQLIMSIYLFPFIYFIILFMPISLLYDYGSYFLTYLNGVGKSSVLMLELLFDYIAVSIFFLRLMVQNVRLVFMLFTYGELHELVVFFNIDRNLILMNESFADGWNNTKTNFNLSNWYLLLKLPVLLLNWLYELFHTFFMVIFQFIAFFAMIFWLFLFLYTMFVLETQENFYTFKRSFRRNYFSKIVNFKNLILQK